MFKVTVFFPALPNGKVLEFETPEQAQDFADNMLSMGLRVDMEHPVLNGVVFSPFVKRVIFDARLSDVEVVKFVRCITGAGLRETLNFCRANGLIKIPK